MSTVTITTWIGWALIGFIGGFMVGRYKSRGGGYTFLNVIVGAIFAMAGGWIFCKLFGAGEQMQYLSLVIAVVTTAIGLWILGACTPHRRDGDDELTE